MQASRTNACAIDRPLGRFDPPRCFGYLKPSTPLHKVFETLRTAASGIRNPVHRRFWQRTRDACGTIPTPSPRAYAQGDALIGANAFSPVFGTGSCLSVAFACNCQLSCRCWLPIRAGGFEPPTSPLEGVCSNELSCGLSVVAGRLPRTSLRKIISRRRPPGHTT